MMRPAKLSRTMIEELRAKLEEDNDLASMLTESLQKARAIGKAELDRDLFKALDWPNTIPRYIAYLTKFAR